MDGSRALASCRLEGALELGLLGNLESSYREAELPRRRLRRGQDDRRDLRATEKRDPREIGYCLLQQLKLLGGQLLELGGHASHVSARTGEAGHEPQGHWVGQGYEYDGNRALRLLRRTDRGCTGQHDDVDLSLNELADEGREPIRVLFRPAILDRHRLALDPAQLAKASTERLRLRGHHRRLPVAEVAYPGGSGWLRLAHMRYRCETESEKNREPDQPHGHLTRMAGGSLAEVKASDLVCFSEARK